MKRLIPALLALVLVASLAACNNTKSPGSDTSGESSASDTPAAVTTVKPADTTAKPAVTTVAKTEPVTEAPKPLTSLDYEKVKAEKKNVINLLVAESVETDTDGFSETEGIMSLFDGDTATKYCCSMPPTFSFKLSESKKITAYAFTTANDNEQYGRSPEEYKIYGSKDGKDWKEIEYVAGASSVIERLNFQPYAFPIAADKQGDYQYYKFEILEAEGSMTFQMSELELFTD